MKNFIMLSILFLLSSPCNVEAANANYTYNEIIPQNTIDDISPYADIIETKYRIYNGKVQYRRWNSSKLCWVDSSWLDL